MRLDPTRLEPARQPEAVAAGFEGNRNPRDLFAGPDRLIAPAMQQAKQPFGIRLQLLARLTLNAGSTPATSQLDWLISITATIVLFWSRATRDLLKACPGAGRGRSAGASRHPSVDAATMVPFPRRPPHSIFRFLVARRSNHHGRRDCSSGKRRRICWGTEGSNPYSHQRGVGVLRPTAARV